MHNPFDIEFPLPRMQSAIILDKSFLQGSKKTRIHELAQTHRLLVSDALFYELLTASEPGRSRCFSKFPPIDNPVDLVDHIGTLMRLEIDSHIPAGKPSTHCEKLRFQFNPRLVNPEYELPEEGLRSVNEQTAQLRSDVLSFIDRCSAIDSFFPKILVGSETQQVQAREEAERAIAEPGALIPFYASLEPPPGQQPLPSASIVTEKWALYRWLQVQLLFSLDLYVRYRGAIPENISPTTYEKIEHDVLDAQVMMLGCLEGAFATREKKLIRWWNLICPDGTLY